MKVLGTFYGRCDAATWQDAEKVAGDELLHAMDFTDIRHLSKKDAIFPFDFVAEKLEEKYLIDVTLRTRKPVRTKRLEAWRTLGYKTALLCILPQRMMAILLEIDADDRWVRVSPSMIRKSERELDEFLHQNALERDGLK